MKTTDKGGIGEGFGDYIDPEIEGKKMETTDKGGIGEGFGDYIDPETEKKRERREKRINLLILFDMEILENDVVCLGATIIFDM